MFRGKQKDGSRRDGEERLKSCTGKKETPERDINSKNKGSAEAARQELSMIVSCRHAVELQGPLGRRRRRRNRRKDSEVSQFSDRLDLRMGRGEDPI